MKVSASMRERQKIAKERQKETIIEIKKEICDDCKYATWNTDFFNLDLEGKPITLRCPYYEDGKFGIIRGSQACKRFIKK